MGKILWLKKNSLTNLERIILIFFIFVFSLIPFLWLHKGELILGYDNAFPLDPIAFVKDRAFSWSSTQGFEMDQSGMQGSIIIHFLDALPRILGFSDHVSQKIVFSFWFFMLLFAPYFLILRLEKAGFVKTPYLRFIFPILYAFNFYILQAWWVAERTKFSLVVATPLILSIILPMIKEILSIKQIFKKASICALILTIFNGGGWIGLPLYGGLLITLISFFFFFSMIFILSKKKKEFLYLNLFFLFFACMFIFLNAYTIFPFIFKTLKDYNQYVAESGGASSFIEWARYLSTDTSFLNLLRQQGIPDWYGNEGHPYAAFYFKNYILVLSSFLFPSFIFLSFFKKRKEIRIFFLFVLIISLLFTAGTHKPLGFIVEFLLGKVPGFIIFRSTIFKFGYAYWLSGSFLIGCALSDFIEYLLIKFYDSLYLFLIRGFSILAILGAIVAYHFPYFTGDIFHMGLGTMSSRVKTPTYVYDFAKWWKVNGKASKILLLPKLNEVWFFEQYQWNYLSLFPVLGNFASEGIIENISSLKSKERVLLDSLYSAINNKDYARVDTLTSILGLQYFLVRKDFFYDFPDQETDNPAFIEKNLKNNPQIEEVISFGEWVVYRYKKAKPLIHADNFVSLIDRNISDNLSYPSGIEIISDKNILKNEMENTFLTYTFSPYCLSCEAERLEIDVEFPKLKILPNSDFYDLVKFKDKFSYKTKGTEYSREYIISLISQTLRSTAQIDELIKRDISQNFINKTEENFIHIIDQIEKELPEIKTKDSNPYFLTMLIQQYLTKEEKLLNYILINLDRKSFTKGIEKVLDSIFNLNNQLEEFYSVDDFNIKNIYKIDLDTPGEYELKLRKNTLGFFVESNLEDITLSIDNKKPTSLTGIIEEDFFNFGKFYLTKGTHQFKLDLPKQKELINNTVHEKLAGNVCFSSIVKNFSENDFYSLSFNIKNNFDPTFFLFIDENTKFNPNFIVNFPMLGERRNDNRIIISSKNLALNKDANNLRISFCAPGLTKDFYKESIKNLSLIKLIYPQIVLYKKNNVNLSSPPGLDFKKVNQGHYSVNIKDANHPFYLIFAQRFDLGWQASMGQHMIANGYENAWFIDKKGSYVVDIYYDPQRFFYYGFIISGVTFISIILLIFVNKRKRCN